MYIRTIVSVISIDSIRMYHYIYDNDNEFYVAMYVVNGRCM